MERRPPSFVETRGEGSVVEGKKNTAAKSRERGSLLYEKCFGGKERKIRRSEPPQKKILQRKRVNGPFRKY